MKAAIIVHRQGFWAYDTVLACRNIDWYAYEDKKSLFNENINPYKLSTADSFDIIYIASHTWRSCIRGQHNEVRAVTKLRKSCDKLVLIDGWDSFDLSIPPFTIELFDIVLKTNGVYRDKDLYNYKVGCDYPGVNWTNKILKKEFSYGASHLDKVRLSFPCQVGVVNTIKRRLRVYNGNISAFSRLFRNTADRFIQRVPDLLSKSDRKKSSLYFFGDLAHQQRLDLLHLLAKNKVEGEYKVFRVLDKICGRPNWREKKIDLALKRKIEVELKRLGMIAPKKNRMSYLMGYLNHKFAISPVGFGEMCFRHLEIMQMGCCGIIQDISHVDHYAPFKEGENIIFCRPDFSDLIAIMNSIESNLIDYERIGQNARKDAKEWEAQIDHLLYKSLIEPVV